MKMFPLQANMLLSFLIFSMLMKQQVLYDAFGFTSQPTIVGLTIIFQYILSPYNEVRLVFTFDTLVKATFGQTNKF